MLISCGQDAVAVPQRVPFKPMVGWCFGFFAYNELPTIAVAISCWFWARQHLTRPFFMPSSL
jgi:hypothetical protein